MRRSLLLVSLCFASAFTLACGDQPGPSAPDLRTGEPDGPGAFVVRFEEPVAILLSTEESGLTVLAGVTAAELAEFCAGGEPTFETGTRLNVFRPDGSLHSVLKAEDLSVLVWQGAFADVCTPPFATGTGRFMYVDNDVFVSGSGANAFGFRINGDVSSTTGQRYHVTANFHAIISPSDEFRGTKEEIRLTPRG